VQITVTTKGPGFDHVMRGAARDLRSANRKVGRTVARTGVAAIRKGAPTMWGRKLSAKTKVDAWPDRAVVTFKANPAGGWAMQESGTRPHPIKARRRKALHWGGGDEFSLHVAHPGTSGHKAWTKAKARLVKAIKPEIEDVYDDALGA
jgi:hypothetical protein